MVWLLESPTKRMTSLPGSFVCTYFGFIWISLTIAFTCDITSIVIWYEGHSERLRSNSNPNGGSLPSIYKRVEYIRYSRTAKQSSKLISLTSSNSVAVDCIIDCSVFLPRSHSTVANCASMPANCLPTNGEFSHSTACNERPTTTLATTAWKLPLA